MAESELKSEAVEAEGVLEESLLGQIMEKTKIKETDEVYPLAKKGVELFLSEIISSSRYDQRVEKALVDQVIAEIDAKLSRQLDAIMHNEDFQKLESSWRGLKLVVDRTNFKENIELVMMDVSKQALEDDFVDNPDISQTGLYKHVYTAEYGQFGGKPVATMIANYEFGPTAPDIKLLEGVGAVATMAHAPFIAAAGAKFFDIDSFEDLPSLKDVGAIFEGPRFAKWNSFRESEDARYIALTVPRFLLRLPYGGDDNPVKAFDYNENVDKSHFDFLWGNTSFAFATRLTDSFAKYRWCPNIVGPKSGGAMENLPLHHFESMGEIQTKIPTEALISDRREYELAEQGFIGLTMRKGSDNASFFSANSVQKPKKFANTVEGKTAETNYKLGTELPYMFIITRLAHYIKTLQRENLGSWKTKPELEKELSSWLQQYISDQENPPPGVRSRRPLRAAEITITEPAGEPGWFSVQLDVVPHFKYMGANFTLSLKGKLEKG
jgi:type VI secretion system protein ImpC